MTEPGRFTPGERATLHNDLSGATREVVQAQRVGSVHFHRPADTPDLPPRQLPADVRGFVNRTADLARLDLLLSGGSESDENATAVCLIAGTAGVGKTSLAIHWAHRVATSFPDGQLYVNLRGYDPGAPVTASEALERFLRALDVPSEVIPSDVESRAALYRSRLAGRKVLVVLDNVATTSQVRQLLPGVPGCLVLVTSRNRLSGLVARDGARPLPLTLLDEDDAVDLLRTVTSGYRTSDDLQDLRELATLCARLPLALRIAAERAISRPWRSMRTLIDDLRDESGLWDALTAEDDDESDAVRTVFAWSYRALPPEAGRLFRCLGLHPGPDFRTEAAAALADLTVPETRRLLDSLVGAHLLEQVQPDRYQFHDLLRLYALNQARTEESPQTCQEAVRRIVLWYLHSLTEARTFLAPEAAPLSLPAPAGTAAELDGHSDAHTWFELEEWNLRATVGFADELHLPELAWLLAAALYPVYANRNQIDHWIATSEIGLAAARQLPDPHGEAILLESLGKANAQAVRLSTAVQFQTEALTIHTRLGNVVGRITSTNAIGLAHLRAHELPAALSRFESAAGLADEIDSAYWRATATNNTANVYLELERFDEADDLLGHALADYEQLRLPGHRGDVLRGLSHADRGRDRFQTAQEHIGEALDIARQHNNLAWEAFWLVESGQVLAGLGDLPDALTAFQRASMLHRRLGDRSREATAMDGAGTVYRLMDRADEAADFHRLAVSVFRDTGEQWRLATALDHLALSVAAAEAEEHWLEAHRLLAPFSDPHAVRLRHEIENRLG
jgi:tetratricopeptide (TPR) repeat protein